MDPDRQPRLILADDPPHDPSPAASIPSPRHRRTGRAAGDPSAAPAPFPSAAGLTALAFLVVGVPFAVAVVRLLATPGGHIYLPDDLALIDLHTRRALEWRQQLGVFDHNNWNHPGPAYFYLLSLGYRLFGSGAKAMFVGATLINALAALGCVEVVRRRSTPARALWAALWICVLASVLAAVSPGSTTYSEGALGALVSPWNPMVVIFPLLLVVLLGAAAVDRSALSLVAVVVVGSVVVQTDISTLPLVATVVVVAGVVWTVTALADRRRPGAHAGGAPTDAEGSGATVEGAGPPPWRRWAWAGAALAVLVVMWIPPVVQQVTNHPGNFTLIYRFFTAPHQGQSLGASLRSAVSAFGVMVVGPSEIMSSLLGGTPRHPAAAVATTAVVVALAATVAVVGVHQRRRFAAGLGSLTLIGCVTTVVAVSHVVGFVFGYLVIWAVVIPVGALIGSGLLPRPLRWSTAGHRSSSPARPVLLLQLGLCTLAVVAGVVLTVRVVALPDLRTVSDPRVEHLFSLVAPSLDPRGTVFVGDNGAGTQLTGLLDTEEFIGLVNQLDAHGYHPRVNHLWRAQFGPGYVAPASSAPRQVQLYTWAPTSSRLPGYAGRVGDMAVVVIGRGS